MKIAILSRDGTLYSCRRLREAAQQRGHQIEILDPLSCYMNVSPVASSIHYKGRQLPHFDAVIPRIGSAITYYGTAALRQFELLGSYPLNESVAITRARDKLRSLQLLALSADLSAINASSLTVKAFIDIQDDNLPKLVVCQSLSIGPGVTMEQFAWFFRQSEEQISMVILEAGANQLLYKGEEEEPAAENVQYHFLH